MIQILNGLFLNQLNCDKKRFSSVSSATFTLIQVSHSNQCETERGWCANEEGSSHFLFSDFASLSKVSPENSQRKNCETEYVQDLKLRRWASAKLNHSLSSIILFFSKNNSPKCNLLFWVKAKDWRGFCQTEVLVGLHPTTRELNP